MIELGVLERVPARRAWEHEARGFTPWLAQAENLTQLAQALNLSLAVEATEYAIGSFKADIIARETVSAATVIIENQLERTNHAHLGQIITYAAGARAEIVIWIAETFASEHIAALTWLNENMPTLRFYGVQIEAWRIGNSKIAPKFNPLVAPNEWSRGISEQVQGIPTGEKRRKLKEVLQQAILEGKKINLKGMSALAGVSYGMARNNARAIIEEITQELPAISAPAQVAQDREKVNV